METAEYFKRLYAAERRGRAADRAGERDRFVHFDEWARVARGVSDVLAVPQRQRGWLYREYQGDMIAMHFLEWDRARVWGLPEYYDLFG